MYFAVNYNINICSNGSGDLGNLYRELLGGSNLGKLYREILGKLLVELFYIVLLLLGGIYSCTNNSRGNTYTFTVLNPRYLRDLSHLLN